jgi:hypothetical protein
MFLHRDLRPDRLTTVRSISCPNNQPNSEK